ncbi:MAG: hypothetical protein M0P31_14515 [Solirubrobacteraceae bacterium]|nr:hypothetical protein [Solirubrobacteraceae bacterium]
MERLWCAVPANRDEQVRELAERTVSAIAAKLAEIARDAGAAEPVVAVSPMERPLPKPDIDLGLLPYVVCTCPRSYREGFPGDDVSRVKMSRTPVS